MPNISRMLKKWFSQTVQKEMSARRKGKAGPKRIPIREDLTFPQQRRNRIFFNSHRLFKKR